MNRMDDIKMDNQEWHWDGSIWSFIEVVQWAFVFHRLGKEGKPGDLDIMSDPEKVKLKAEEYGMTYRTIVKEMLRISKDGQAMFEAIDETKRREQKSIDKEKED